MVLQYEVFAECQGKSEQSSKRQRQSLVTGCEQPETVVSPLTHPPLGFAPLGEARDRRDRLSIRGERRLLQFLVALLLVSSFLTSNEKLSTINCSSHPCNPRLTNWRASVKSVDETTASSNPPHPRLTNWRASAISAVNKFFSAVSFYSFSATYTVPAG
jgi:hypothetical protein